MKKIITILVLMIISSVIGISTAEYDYDYYNDNYDYDCSNTYSDGIWSYVGYDHWYTEYGYTIDDLVYTYEETQERDYSGWHDDDGNSVEESSCYYNELETETTDEYDNTYEYTRECEYTETHTENSSSKEKTISEVEDEVCIEVNHTNSYHYEMDEEFICNRTWDYDETYEYTKNKTGEIHEYEEYKIEYPNGTSEADFNGADYTYTEMRNETHNDYYYHYDYDVEGHDIETGIWYEGTESDNPDNITRYEEGIEGECIHTYEYGREEGAYYQDSDYSCEVEGYNKTTFTNKTAGVVTVTEERCENRMSSPVLGLGYNGSVKGDKLPILYTWRPVNDKHNPVTTENPPAKGENVGSVIVTPARTAGEPIEPYEMKYRGAKGARIAEWHTNHNGDTLETNEEPEEEITEEPEE